MLLIILIGAALRHVQPEQHPGAKLPANPQRNTHQQWRCINGVASVLALASPPKNPRGAVSLKAAPNTKQAAANRGDDVTAHHWAKPKAPPERTAQFPAPGHRCRAFSLPYP